MNMNLLLIDDDTVDRLSTKRALGGSPRRMQITEASSAEQGLKFAKNQQFDLILLDYQLPTMNGLELLFQLRSNVEKKPAVIMLSHSNDDDLAIQCIEAGAQDFLMKSEVTTSRLTRAIMQSAERFRVEQQLVQLANFDPLTGLANRTFFLGHQQAALVHASREKKKLATLFIDLDRFKEVNDKWGHDVGDQLLKSVATRIREAVRESDVIARLGGDEFAILLDGIEHHHQAAVVAQKILDRLSIPHKLEGHEVFGGASIGIACYPDAGDSYREINQAADAAMYHAKKQGRNGYRFFDPALQKEVVERASLTSGLRESLQAGELTVVYQPKVTSADRKLAGMEALARWTHPKLGPISPGVFIPLAEETGLIGEIGEWVLREACRGAKSLQTRIDPKLVHDLAVSVNVSAKQLKLPNFVEMVRRTIEETELSASNLKFELTESSVMEDPEASIQILRAIRDLGVGIAIDDFGTGYSSLSYLGQLPIDAVKIDLSFVQAIGRDSGSESIVKSIIALAHTLGLETIAEGVESQDQIDFLCTQGCDFLQGYYFGKPAGLDEISVHFVS